MTASEEIARRGGASAEPPADAKDEEEVKREDCVIDGGQGQRGRASFCVMTTILKLTGLVWGERDNVRV